jgi:hypothetical protein
LVAIAKEEASHIPNLETGCVLNDTAVSDCPPKFVTKLARITGGVESFLSKKSYRYMLVSAISLNQLKQYLRN